jgi:hypothetical protein
MLCTREVKKGDRRKKQMKKTGDTESRQLRQKNHILVQRNGALVVAPERSIQFSIEQLRRVISEFSEYILYIITQVTRYISMPCCDIPEHVTNFQDPDFLGQILADLTKLKFSLRKKLSPAIILDGIELVCGAGCSKERVEQTLRARWASDPVHPNAHIYAKMALNLLETERVQQLLHSGQPATSAESAVSAVL